MHKSQRVIIHAQNPANGTTHRAKYSNRKHVGGSPPVYATPHPQRANYSDNTLAILQKVANEDNYGESLAVSVPSVLYESVTHSQITPINNNPQNPPPIPTSNRPTYYINPVESAYNKPRRPIHNPINSHSYTKPITLNKSKFIPEFYELVTNFTKNIKYTLRTRRLNGDVGAKKTIINYIELLEQINTILQDPKKTKIILSKDQASNYNRLYFNLNKVDYKFPVASILWNKTTKQSPSKQQNYTTIINQLLRYKEILENNMTVHGANYNRF
jgi:hypothetical protein